MPEPSPLVSVLVCTRNRSHHLADCLQALSAVEDPGGSWEIVVVDNHSTDDTVEVARTFERRDPQRFRVVIEPEIGLSAARNRAIREARGDILAFLDDDAFPATGWLRSLVDVLERPGALAAGGPVEPLLQGELPPWFHERYLPYLTVWDRGPEVIRLVYNEYPRGANMAFRREVFERFGLFTHHLGRKGQSLLSSEETELCLRIERAGGDVLYAPTAGVRHLTVAERVTARWLVRRFGAQGRSEAILHWMHGGLRTLLLGSRLHIANARAAARALDGKEDSRILARCQRAALVGYLREMPRAPIRVPRYRPPRDLPTPPWRPFG